MDIDPVVISHYRQYQPADLFPASLSETATFRQAQVILN